MRDCARILRHLRDDESRFITGSVRAENAALRKGGTMRSILNLEPVYRGVLLTAFAAIPSAVVAQTIFTDVTATHLPQAASLHSLDAGFGDFNGDGHLDIAIAAEWDVNRIYLNDGTGKFTYSEGALYPGKHDTEDLVIADFNKDGHLDIVFVAEDDFINEMYLGDGTGKFQEVNSRIPNTGKNQAVVAADINGDGYPDLLIGNISGGDGDGINRLLINMGSENPGFFRDETSTRMTQIK